MAISTAQLDAKINAFPAETFFRVNATDMAGVAAATGMQALPDGTYRYAANMSLGIQQYVVLMPNPVVNVGDILLGY